MNVILALILAVLLAILAGLLYLCLSFRSILLAFQDFTTPDDKGKSALGEFIGSICNQMVTVFRTSFMGLKSGESRGEQAVMGALMEDTAGQSSPMLAAGLQAFPALRKLISKNPGLLEFALSKIQSLNKPSEAAASGNHADSGGDGSFKASLNRFGG